MSAHQAERRFERFADFVAQYSAHLSLSGMFLESEEMLPVGGDVVVGFHLSDDFRLFRGEGEVLWVRPTDEHGPPGIGIRFRTLDEAGRNLVLKVLEEHIKSGGEPFDVEDLPPGARIATLSADPAPEPEPAPEPPPPEPEAASPGQDGFGAPWGDDLPDFPDEILEDGHEPGAGDAMIDAVPRLSQGADLEESTPVLESEPDPVPDPDPELEVAADLVAEDFEELPSEVSFDLSETGDDAEDPGADSGEPSFDVGETDHDWADLEEKAEATFESGEDDEDVEAVDWNAPDENAVSFDGEEDSVFEDDFGDPAAEVAFGGDTAPEGQVGFDFDAGPGDASFDGFDLDAPSASEVAPSPLETESRASDDDGAFDLDSTALGAVAPDDPFADETGPGKDGFGATPPPPAAEVERESVLDSVETPFSFETPSGSASTRGEDLDASLLGSVDSVLGDAPAPPAPAGPVSPSPFSDEAPDVFGVKAPTETRPIPKSFTPAELAEPALEADAARKAASGFSDDADSSASVRVDPYGYGYSQESVSRLTRFFDTLQERWIAVLLLVGLVAGGFWGWSERTRLMALAGFGDVRPGATSPAPRADLASVDATLDAAEDAALGDGAVPAGDGDEPASGEAADAMDPPVTRIPASAVTDGDAAASPSPPVSPPPPVRAPPPPPSTLSAPPAPAVSGAPARAATSISASAATGGTRVVLQLDGSVSEARVSSYQLGSGSPRALVVVKGIETPYLRSEIAAGTAELSRIRTGHHQKDTGPELHVVLDLTGPDVRLGDVVVDPGGRVTVLLSGS